MIEFEADGLQIVRLGPDDAQGLWEIYKQCEDFLALGPVPRVTIEMIQGDIAHSRSLGGQYGGIRTAEGQMIGVVDFIPRTGEEATGFIELLMIAAPWRHRGIGRTVVTALEQHLRNRYQVRKVESAVQTNNGAAIRFWAALGYPPSLEVMEQPDGTVTHCLCKTFASGR